MATNLKRNPKKFLPFPGFQRKQNWNKGKDGFNDSKPKHDDLRIHFYLDLFYGRESWDYKESWALKNSCFWTVVLEKTLESPLDYKEIQPLHPKGDQFWIFIGRTDVEAEAPILWPPLAKSWLVGTNWCWEGLRAGGEGDSRGWDGLMASPSRWIWVWVNSENWWWTGRPCML